MIYHPHCPVPTHRCRPCNRAVYYRYRYSQSVIPQRELLGLFSPCCRHDVIFVRTNRPSGHTVKTYFEDLRPLRWSYLRESAHPYREAILAATWSPYPIVRV
jgi:hypothetical protein